jgi:hypothetical protein
MAIHFLYSIFPLGVIWLHYLLFSLYAAPSMPEKKRYESCGLDGIGLYWQFLVGFPPPPPPPPHPPPLPLFPPPPPPPPAINFRKKAHEDDWFRQFADYVH